MKKLQKSTNILLGIMMKHSDEFIELGDETSDLLTLCFLLATEIFQCLSSR